MESSFEKAGIRVLIKREDLNHNRVCGNKWWKLKYNLIRARELGHDTLLTFGGAYSNHLYAVAAAARELRMKAIGIVRGESTLPLNSTLDFVTKNGMHLHYLTRTEYKDKSSEGVLQNLSQRFGKFYLIPEGGTNEEAVMGCVEFGRKLTAESPFDFVVLPVATGGTMAGVIQALHGNQTAIGVSVLKNGGFLQDEVKKWLPEHCKVSWRIETRFDFGGYAKTTPELEAIINKQREMHHLPLDHVYTGKTFFGLTAMIGAGEFPRGSTVMMIHTGGLQGSGSIDHLLPKGEE